MYIQFVQFAGIDVEVNWFQLQQITKFACGMS